MDGFLLRLWCTSFSLKDLAVDEHSIHPSCSTQEPQQQTRTSPSRTKGLAIDRSQTTIIRSSRVGRREAAKLDRFRFLVLYYLTGLIDCLIPRSVAISHLLHNPSSIAPPHATVSAVASIHPSQHVGSSLLTPTQRQRQPIDNVRTRAASSFAAATQHHHRASSSAAPPVTATTTASASLHPAVAHDLLRALQDPDLLGDVELVGSAASALKDDTTNATQIQQSAPTGSSWRRARPSFGACSTAAFASRRLPPFT